MFFVPVKVTDFLIVFNREIQTSKTLEFQLIQLPILQQGIWYSISQISL